MNLYRNNLTIGDIPQLSAVTPICLLNDPLDSFTNWVNSGCSITSNGTPSGNCFTIPLSKNCHRQNTLQGTSWGYELDMLCNSNSLINFFVGCNSDGAGMMIRIDTRSSGSYWQFVPSTGWDDWGATLSSTGSGSANTWYKVKVTYVGTTLSYYINNSLVLSATVTLTGNWIGFHGDGAGTGGRVDNLIQLF